MLAVGFLPQPFNEEHLSEVCNGPATLNFYFFFIFPDSPNILTYSTKSNPISTIHLLACSRPNFVKRFILDQAIPQSAFLTVLKASLAGPIHFQRISLNSRTETGYMPHAWREIEPCLKKWKL
jgi:hypothetical protein